MFKISVYIGIFTFVMFAGNLVADSNSYVAADKDCSSRVCFPRLTKIGSSDIPLASSILFRYYLWKPYSIALYAEPENASKSGILQDVPKKLVLHYHMDFSATEIIQAADEILRSNPNVDMQEIGQSLATINALYKDVKEGDSYSLEYDPSAGTKLILNNIVLGTVPGAKFAHSYFGIWLSDYSLSSSLTESLLAALQHNAANQQLAG